MQTPPFRLLALPLAAALSSHVLAEEAQKLPQSPANPNYASQVQRLPAVSKPLKGQASATGLIDGQALKLTTRNFAAIEHNRDNWSFSIPKSDGSLESTHRRSTWVQGTALHYNSGYTEGTVGVGLDAAAFNVINLERGKGRIDGGGNRTLADDDGRGVAEWSKLGVANLRARVSSTELKVGRFLVDTPVFGYIDNRALPSSFNGLAISSAELDNLMLQGGSFTKASPRTGAGTEAFTSEYGSRTITSSRFSYLGGSYKPVDSLELALYGARFKDIWNQYYLGVTHTLGDREQLALKTAFNGYHTRDSGARQAGYIDNNAWSLAFTLAHQAHALTFAWQRIIGDEYFDYVHETAAIYLANSLLSDYNGPNERSAQLRYEADWGYFGVPGLTTAAWYAKGWGIDGTGYDGDRNGAHGDYAEVRRMDGERHHEYGVSVAYTLQDGRLKDSSFKLMLMDHRGSTNQADGSVREVRLVSTLPFNLL